MTSLPPNVSQLLSPSPETQAQPEPGSSEKKHITKLSTSSPEAIRVASAITPNRLANLLMRNGPLAIRLITAQLSIEVPGFDLLSLSKQRRLIMAAMEQGDPQNNVVFEKIGWGQWAVRHVDSDYIVTEPNGALDGSARLNIHELRETAKLGWLKKIEPARRDSISNNKSNMHNFRLPGEKLESPSTGMSDSEQDSDDDEDMGQPSSGSDELTNMRNLKMHDENGSAMAKSKKSPPLKFANRVPTKFSPPPALSGGRRKLSSGTAPNSVVKNTNLHGVNRHQLFNRSRLNSIENLDEYILSSARNSSLSVLSPTVHNSSLPSSSPVGSWNGKGELLHKQELPLPGDHITTALQNAGRRKLSFNESSIRSTLSTSLPRGHALSQKPYENGNSSILSTFSSTGPRKAMAVQDMASDTDEEDWATLGAETLRSHPVKTSNPTGGKLQNEERSAARALVDLMGI
ncbi:hypothetical protein METBIDRAFT_35355 [Metschnikowia bicuspidata var. bicuspidata NRRL YB-4993]|uniref:Sin3 binding protein n=1 Tax=Metschnikowia bicuspidata var. bicuspidata NRRL YB-4993 TaxID=869754 RepID=A0A1A0HHA1_9ASCO|nr:hypothetical protein METBIDRAFT_35355 [Metschnikowia bicuspidata var. bicuspidata NRRL YB-4993]OBA23559.1 hypothetical protein METBIDRAFT_35355 [Metschnikowia bicuspidata var. bicuspidata NRRL YB-4993]